MDRSLEITNRDAGPAPAMEPEDRQQQQQPWKRRKTSHGVTNPSSSLLPPPSPPASRWRTGWEQQLFSSKLLSALRRVRSVTPSAHTALAGTGPPPGSRAVRDAADRILAAAAGGRSRWSRAVLRRHRTKARAPRRHAHAEPRGPAPTTALLLERERMERKRKAGGAGGESSGGNGDVLRAKAKVLGRLVPGCRKASFPSLLEETSDYIAALEMQVRAMSALAEMLTSMGSGSSSSGGGGAIAGGNSSVPTSSAAGPSRLS